MDPLRKNKFGRFSRMDSGVFGSKLVKNGLKEVAKDINGLRQFPTFKEGPWVMTCSFSWPMKTKNCEGGGWRSSA